MMDTYDRAFLVHADNVGSKQFMDIRAVSGRAGAMRRGDGCRRMPGRGLGPAAALPPPCRRRWVRAVFSPPSLPPSCRPSAITPRS